MTNKVIAGKTILLNTKTNCTFIADKLDEEVQAGTRENDRHIEIAGQLDIPVTLPVFTPYAEVEDLIGDFHKELTVLLNKYNKENGSNTPDYLLSEYLIGALSLWNKSVMRRSEWYEFRDSIGNS